jgi:hypothetical protein
MSKRPTYTVAMRDYSWTLGWIWVCVPGSAPPRQPALLWKELVVVAPGVVKWACHSQPEERVIRRAEGR